MTNQVDTGVTRLTQSLGMAEQKKLGTNTSRTRKGLTYWDGKLTGGNNKKLFWLWPKQTLGKIKESGLQAEHKKLSTQVNPEAYEQHELSRVPQMNLIQGRHGEIMVWSDIFVLLHVCGVVWSLFCIISCVFVWCFVFCCCFHLYHVTGVTTVLNNDRDSLQLLYGLLQRLRVLKMAAPVVWCAWCFFWERCFITVLGPHLDHSCMFAWFVVLLSSDYSVDSGWIVDVMNPPLQ